MASNLGTPDITTTTRAVIVGRNRNAPASSTMSNISGRITALNKSGTRRNVSTSVRRESATAIKCCETPGLFSINKLRSEISIATTAAVFTSKAQGAIDQLLAEPDQVTSARWDWFSHSESMSKKRGRNAPSR